MSPIIYTPHDCEIPNTQGIVAAAGNEALWVCPECDNVWELRDNFVTKAWCLVRAPRREAIVAANYKPVTAPAPTQDAPTITPHMAQLAVDTYEDHMCVFPNDGAAPLGWCGECDAEIREPYTIQAHAREKAAEALQGALRGETHG